MKWPLFYCKHSFCFTHHRKNTQPQHQRQEIMIGIGRSLSHLGSFPKLCHPKWLISCASTNLYEYFKCYSSLIACLEIEHCVRLVSELSVDDRKALNFSRLFFKRDIPKRFTLACIRKGQCLTQVVTWLW